MPFTPFFRLRLACVAGATALIGCAVPKPPPAHVPLILPDQWQAPLPHQGSVQDLRTWWQQFDDPLLGQLIEAAQQVSPSVASAASRIAQAHSAEQIAGAALRPQADLSGSASRGRQTTLVGAPLGTLAQVRSQASWEMDVFGRLGNAQQAALARTDGAEAAWHEARVAVAAEVAQLYFSWRACHALVALAAEAQTSRLISQRLTENTVKGGFAPTSDLALAKAGVADGAGQQIQQQALCDTDQKGLVALSGLPELELQQKQPFSQILLADKALFSIANIPAKALMQRPDIAQAAREVAAASAEVGSAEAERYPRLTLAGSIGQVNFRSGGSGFNLTAWTLGPVTLTLPLLDGGKFSANLSASKARYEEAVVLYRAKARQAVREVELALVALHSSSERRPSLRLGLESHQRVLAASQARHKAGFGTLAALEDARRAVINSQTALVTGQRDTTLAWVSLYRAVGGGWLPTVTDTTPLSAQKP